MTSITGNSQLAARARELAARTPRDSLERKAAGCLAVALGTTDTIRAAREALGNVQPDDVRDVALKALGDSLDGEAVRET